MAELVRIHQRRFAEDTKVPIGRTRDQIVDMMRKAGADAFALL